MVHQSPAPLGPSQPFTHTVLAGPGNLWTLSSPLLSERRPLPVLTLHSLPPPHAQHRFRLDHCPGHRQSRDGHRCSPALPQPDPTPPPRHHHPPVQPRVPGSHQNVCFRIMPCSSSHVFLASAVLPFPASTMAGGNSRTGPSRRGFQMGPTPLSYPGSTGGGGCWEQFPQGKGVWRGRGK